jgi:hypothetical protein
MHRAVVLFTCTALSILSGCGSRDTGTVSGKVTYRDQPLQGGSVVFATSDLSRIERVSIQSDGTYQSAFVPVGDLMVAVEPAPPGPQAHMPKGAKLPPNIPPDSPGAQVYLQANNNHVDIPAKYRDPTTSELKLSVNSGTQKYDIQLTDAN